MQRHHPRCIQPLVGLHRCQPLQALLSRILQQCGNRGVLGEDPYVCRAPPIQPGCPRSAQCPHRFRDLLSKIQAELRRPRCGG
eukprot:12182147-Prorocentrum_lima.AAC.1